MASNQNDTPWSYVSPANRRYESDPAFRNVVDILRAFLQEYRLTPSELREAVVLAATMHEMTIIRPLIFRNREWVHERDMMKPPAMFGGNMADASSRTPYPGPLSTPKIEEKK